MYVSRTNHYTFTDEEKKALRKVRTIFNSLSNNLFYSADDYYKLDNFNLNHNDINIICNALSALVNASDICNS